MKTFSLNVCDYNKYKDFVVKHDPVITDKGLNVNLFDDHIDLKIDMRLINIEREKLASHFIKDCYNDLTMNDDFKNRLMTYGLYYINIYDFITNYYKATILCDYVVNGEFLTDNASSLAKDYISKSSMSYVRVSNILRDIEEITGVKISENYILRFGEDYTIKFLVGRISHSYLKEVEENNIIYRVNCFKYKKRH